MNFKEIELKFKADKISIKDFRKFCESRAGYEYITTSGFDQFFESPKDSTGFLRHRKENSRFNQLTFKRKLAEKNNFIRNEINISLGLEVTESQVTALAKELGYDFSFALFKNCFIWKFPLYTLVVYVCYDDNLKEIGRFIEIEMDEDHDWGSEDAAWQALTNLEKQLEPLGITAQNRVKRSLFEMFKPGAR